MFEENVILFSFCCKWMRSFFECFVSFSKFSNTIWRNWGTWRKNVLFQEIVKLFTTFWSWKKAFCQVFDVFLQNRQGSLVSKNNKKQSLVMQSDKREKIVKKMWCSQKRKSLQFFQQTLTVNSSVIDVDTARHNFLVKRSESVRNADFLRKYTWIKRPFLQRFQQNC